MLVGIHGEAKIISWAILVEKVSYCRLLVKNEKKVLIPRLGYFLEQHFASLLEGLMSW